ncbi:MAG: SpoIID/LytB domain-containing protein [Bacteroidota bacterium]|nr:SpoIID/LytB domain-containing protein [Bacteroidota bacterium]
MVLVDAVSGRGSTTGTKASCHVVSHLGQRRKQIRPVIPPERCRSTATRAWAALLLLVIAASCSGPPRRTEWERNIPAVRVCIAEGARSVLLATPGRAVILIDQDRVPITDSTAVTCAIGGGGTIDVHAGRQWVGSGNIVRCWHTEKDRCFTMSGRRYPDTLCLLASGDGLVLVNTLPLERYLLGVLPNEIGGERTIDDFEAVKAQAILARTYAMRKAGVPLARFFDVYADARDQVYSGVVAVSDLLKRAVSETSGDVLEYGGKPAECYYHAVCGGNTEAVSLIWGRSQAKPYLRGVRDADDSGDFCRRAPSYRWDETYARRELEDILRTYLPSYHDSIDAAALRAGGYLLDIRVVKRMPSGRVADLRIVWGDRRTRRVFALSGDRIRRVLRRPDGNAPLRSTLFSLDVDRDAARWITRIRIHGGGEGHGIGLCQWGALERSRSGHDASRILSSYFPGTRISKVY